MPVNIIITSGTEHDGKQALNLIQGITAENLLADKGYDWDSIIDGAKSQGMNPVIPPKSNRKIKRPYDEYLYKFRHIVENAFMWLKRWRGIATRYAKTTKSFISAVHIRCIFLWTKILV